MSNSRKSKLALIFIRAWAIARQAVLDFFGKVKQYFSEALKMAHLESNKVEITAEQVAEYNKIRKSEGMFDANNFANNIISAFNLSEASERKALWDLFKAEKVAENEAKKPAKKVKQVKAKTESISKLCKTLLSMSLSDNERSFIVDISNKRKLTEKQAKWLKDIATKNGISTIEIAIKSPKISYNNCQHEDLGSLGYAHGTTVKCPHCGCSAMVW